MPVQRGAGHPGQHEQLGHADPVRTRVRQRGQERRSRLLGALPAHGSGVSGRLRRSWGRLRAVRPAEAERRTAVRVMRGVPGDLSIVDEVGPAPFRHGVLRIGYQNAPDWLSMCACQPTLSAPCPRIVGRVHVALDFAGREVAEAPTGTATEIVTAAAAATVPENSLSRIISPG
jgi:hypothetical protein